MKSKDSSNHSFGRMIGLICIVLAIILNLSGSFLGKLIALNEGVTTKLIILLIILISTYGLRSLCWLIIGKYYQLSFVYPILAINYIFSFCLGIFYFGEEFQMNRLIGSIIIFSGVLIMLLSNNRHEDSIDK